MVLLSRLYYPCSIQWLVEYMCDSFTGQGMNGHIIFSKQASHCSCSCHAIQTVICAYYTIYLYTLTTIHDDSVYNNNSTIRVSMCQRNNSGADK